MTITQSSLLLRLLTSGIFLALFAGAPAAYGEWKGRVVERTTGWPVEGAVVLIVWERCSFISLHGCNSQLYAAAEAVSDSDGRFVISPPLAIRLLSGIAEHRELHVFKAEYGLWNFERRPRRMLNQEQMTKFWQQAGNEGVVLELPPLQTVSQRRSFFWGNSDRKPWLDMPKNRAKLWHEANEAEAKFLEEYEKNFPWGRDVGSSKIEESLRAAPIKCGEPGYPSIECGGRPGGEKLEQKKE